MKDLLELAGSGEGNNGAVVLIARFLVLMECPPSFFTTPEHLFPSITALAAGTVFGTLQNFLEQSLEK